MKVKATYMDLLEEKLKLVKQLSDKVPLTHSLTPTGNNASILLYHIAEAARFWLEQILGIPSYRNEYVRLSEFYMIPEGFPQSEIDQCLNLKEPQKTKSLSAKFEMAFHDKSKINDSFDQALLLVDKVRNSDASLNKEVNLKGFHSSIGTEVDGVKILMHVYAHTLYHYAQLKAIDTLNQ